MLVLGKHEFEAIGLFEPKKGMVRFFSEMVFFPTPRKQKFEVHFAILSPQNGDDGPETACILSEIAFLVNFGGS